MLNLIVFGIFCLWLTESRVSLVAQLVKNSACDAEDPSSILSQEDPLEKA